MKEVSTVKTERVPMSRKRGPGRPRKSTEASKHPRSTGIFVHRNDPVPAQAVSQPHQPPRRQPAVTDDGGKIRWDSEEIFAGIPSDTLGVVILALRQRWEKIRRTRTGFAVLETVAAFRAAPADDIGAKLRQLRVARECEDDAIILAYAPWLADVINGLMRRGELTKEAAQRSLASNHAHQRVKSLLATEVELVMRRLTPGHFDIIKASVHRR